MLDFLPANVGLSSSKCLTVIYQFYSYIHQYLLFEQQIGVNNSYIGQVLYLASYVLWSFLVIILPPPPHSDLHVNYSN